ncbi:DUF1289 domain-containing protein [Caballeronia sp. LZ008]|uniref:DUF1289 domain-containing protein n=1 Tax=unclassified Caballeronia TaxID=2646786 RepID=UPI0020293547|nr:MULTISPECIES: DUF1289 domain-containing protein [unclassified Caballeronia]MDR5797642.1 DUF1289 domain-containing protein [Caballeronia sp. LZ008]
MTTTQDDLPFTIERAKAQEPIGSPCTDVCKLDQETGLCLGCFRSREEIKTFRSMDDAAKLDLFDELLKRRAAKEQTKSPRS